MTDVESTACVRSLEQRVRLGFGLACASLALESLALGWLAAASTFACALLSRSGSLDPMLAHAIAVSGIAGLGAALAWWVEHTPERARYVRRVDVQHGLRGALVTAVESAGTRERSAVAGLLVARTVASTPTRIWLRGAAPRTLVCLGAPLLGLALALAALDASSASNSATVDAGANLAAGSRALASAAHGLRDARARVSSSAAAALQIDTLAGGLEAAAKEIAKLDGKPTRLRTEALRLAGAEQGELPRSLARLEHELLTARAAAEPRSDTRSAIEAALDAVATARTALESGARDASEAAAGEAPGLARDSSDVAAQSAVAGSAGNGRMSAPGDATTDASAPGARVSTSDSAGAPQAPEARGAAGPEGALASGRWWTSGYDGVVERWIEASRQPH